MSGYFFLDLIIIYGTSLSVATYVLIDNKVSMVTPLT